MTIVLLAGGLATRLPDKLLLSVDGQPLLLKAYRQLTRTGRPCLVSVREPLPMQLAQHIDAPTVIDAYENAGPLGGLASAANVVSTPLLFAAAGDLANIDVRIVDELEAAYREATSSSKHPPDAILPRHRNGVVEPLAALYDTAAMRDSSRRSLALGRRKVTSALEGLRVVYHDIGSENERFFLNINTADDLASLQKS